MHKNLVVTFTFAVFGLILPASATAQETRPAVGTWEMTLEGPRGAMTQTLTFAEVETGLSGSLEGPRGAFELNDVSFQDGVLNFVVVRAFRGNRLSQSFSATIEGDTMTGTITGGRGPGERPFTATRRP